MKSGISMLICLLGISVLVSCAATPEDIATEPSTPTPPTASSPLVGSADCVSGYVVGGGDTTPTGLEDAPRRFVFEVLKEDGPVVKIAYTAYPPSPVGDASQVQLDFHAGSVRLGDAIEACGQYNNQEETIFIADQGDFIRTTPTTTILLVRHAEKSSNAENSNLSQEGLVRAQTLAEIAESVPVAQIYTTNFCRSAQTGQPSASALALPLTVHASGGSQAGINNCNPPIEVPIQQLPNQNNTPEELAQEIIMQHHNEGVLVVGHSNTVPEIVTALGAGSPCPAFIPFAANNKCQIPESDFDKLFIVILPEPPGTVQLIVKTYGEPTPP